MESISVVERIKVLWSRKNKFFSTGCKMFHSPQFDSTFVYFIEVQTNRASDEYGFWSDRPETDSYRGGGGGVCSW